MKTEDMEEPSLKRILARVALFILLMFGIHWLALWVHPLGQHNFVWNLVFAAVVLWLMKPSFKARSSARGTNLRALVKTQSGPLLCRESVLT